MARSATDAIFKKLTRGARFSRDEVNREQKRFQFPSSDGNAPGSTHLSTSAVAAQLDYFGMHNKPDLKSNSRQAKRTPVVEDHEDLERMQEGGRLVRAPPQVSDDEDEDVYYDSFSEGEDSDEGEESPGGSSSSDEDHVSVFAKYGVKQQKTNTGKRSSAQLSHRLIVKRLRTQHRIKVQGSEVADPLTSFEDLCNDPYHVDRRLVDNIQACSYLFPTPIQRQAVPILLQGRELFGIAPTGSGKTAAFSIPIFANLQKPEASGVRAIVLAPTRELSQQIFRELSRLGKDLGFNIQFLTHKMVTEYHLNKHSTIDIIVTTPLRLTHMLNTRADAIDLSNVRMLIFDEADKLWEMGFLEQVDDIVSACTHPSIQRALFSATMLPVVEDLAKTVLRDPIRLLVGTKNAATRTIDQQLKFVSTEQGKKLAMKTLINEGLKPPVLIFVQSKERAMALFHELIYWGLNADVISASREKHERDTIVKNFRSGKIWYLISTDVMARGMDFQGVCTVINYDFPVSTVDYIHRIGRTGRAGRAGTAITFFTEEDRELLHSVANVMRSSGCPVEEWMLRLPKLSKQRKRELIRRPIRRKDISGRTLYDKRQRSNRGAIVPKTGEELAKQQKERKELIKRQKEKRQRKAAHEASVKSKKRETLLD